MEKFRKNIELIQKKTKFQNPLKHQTIKLCLRQEKKNFVNMQKKKKTEKGYREGAHGGKRES